MPDDPSTSAPVTSQSQPTHTSTPVRGIAQMQSATSDGDTLDPYRNTGAKPKTFSGKGVYSTKNPSQTNRSPTPPPRTARTSTRVKKSTQGGIINC